MERDCKKCIHHISGACDAWEWASYIGRKETGILELYMLAFELAMEQLKGVRNDY